MREPVLRVNMTFLYKIITTLSFAALLIAPMVVKAESDDFGYKAAAPQALKSGVAGGRDVPTIVGNLINAALSMIGIVFFLIIVYAGFNWMIARGNAEAVDKSKSMIEGAVIGLIIVVSAYAITTFVFDSLDKGATPAAPVAAPATPAA